MISNALGPHTHASIWQVVQEGQFSCLSEQLKGHRAREKGMKTCAPRQERGTEGKKEEEEEVTEELPRD